MECQVRVVCGSAIGPGFALAGLQPVAAETADEGTARVRELLGAPQAGVVLLEEKLYDALPADVRHALGRRPLPIVVPFPGPAWDERQDRAEAHIVELLRQVIGYRVRLR